MRYCTQCTTPIFGQYQLDPKPVTSAPCLPTLTCTLPRKNTRTYYLPPHLPLLSTVIYLLARYTRDIRTSGSAHRPHARHTLHTGIVIIPGPAQLGVDNHSSWHALRNSAQSLVYPLQLLLLLHPSPQDGSHRLVSRSCALLEHYNLSVLFVVNPTYLS